MRIDCSSSCCWSRCPGLGCVPVSTPRREPRIYRFALGALTLFRARRCCSLALRAGSVCLLVNRAVVDVQELHRGGGGGTPGERAERLGRGDQTIVPLFLLLLLLLLLRGRCLRWSFWGYWMINKLPAEPCASQIKKDWPTRAAFKTIQDNSDLGVRDAKREKLFCDACFLLPFCLFL